MTTFPAPKPPSRKARPPKPLRRTQKLTSGAPMKKRNPKRQQSEFQRTLHSRARQKFVASRPCAACGVSGYSQNAHLLGNDGARRKGHYTTVGPLCGPRPSSRIPGFMYSGCHRLYDEHRGRFDFMYPDFNAERVAAQTESEWQAFNGERE